MLLLAESVLRADPGPGRGAAEQWDADVAAQPHPVVAVECELAGVRVAARGIVDASLRPRPVRLRHEPAQNLEAFDLPIAQTGVGIVAVPEVAPVLVEGRAEPHDAPAQLPTAGLDRHLRRAALRVPDADRRGRRRAKRHAKTDRHEDQGRDRSGPRGRERAPHAPGPFDDSLRANAVRAVHCFTSSPARPRRSAPPFPWRPPPRRLAGASPSAGAPPRTRPSRSATGPRRWHRGALGGASGVSDPRDTSR